MFRSGTVIYATKRSISMSVTVVTAAVTQGATIRRSGNSVLIVTDFPPILRALAPCFRRSPIAIERTPRSRVKVQSVRGSASGHQALNL